uniref:Putative secreted protein n=1 Tax=Ixodes ricinus TaxID=34613 RepID=A0A147BQ89_IXORI
MCHLASLQTVCTSSWGACTRSCGLQSPVPLLSNAFQGWVPDQSDTQEDHAQRLSLSLPVEHPKHRPQAHPESS